MTPFTKRADQRDEFVIDVLQVTFNDNEKATVRPATRGENGDWGVSTPVVPVYPCSPNFMRFQLLGPGDPKNSVGDATIIYYHALYCIFHFCVCMSIFHLNYLALNNYFFKVWPPPSCRQLNIMCHGFWFLKCGVHPHIRGISVGCQHE